MIPARQSSHWRVVGFFLIGTFLPWTDSREPPSTRRNRLQPVVGSTTGLPVCRADPVHHSSLLLLHNPPITTRSHPPHHIPHAQAPIEMDLIPPKHVSLPNHDTQSTAGYAPQALGSHIKHIVNVHTSLVSVTIIAEQDRAEPGVSVTVAVSGLLLHCWFRG